MIGWFFRRFINCLCLVVNFLFILVVLLFRNSFLINFGVSSLIHMTWKCMIIYFTSIPLMIARKVRQITIARLFIDITNILDNFLILNALRLAISWDLFSNLLHLLFLASKICIFLWNLLISRFLLIFCILLILLWRWRLVFISSCLFTCFLWHFLRYDSW